MGAQLAVFPEAFIGGYPHGARFGAFFGGRTAEGQEEFAAYLEGAVDVPGKGTEALGAAARQAGMFVSMGIIERDGGTLYCTAVCIGPDGSLLGKHRKLIDAHRPRTPVLGLRRWLDAHDGGYAVGKAGRNDLLGKLHAHDAHGDVQPAHCFVLRANG